MLVVPLLLIGVTNPRDARWNDSCWVLIAGRASSHLCVDRISFKFQIRTSTSSPTGSVSNSNSKSAPLLACRPDQFQIPNPHLYLLVDQTAPLHACRPDLFFKFKFVCLSIERVPLLARRPPSAPLLARRPDQFEIQIQNSDRDRNCLVLISLSRLFAYWTRSDVKYQIPKEYKLTVRASNCLSINVSSYCVFVYSTFLLRYWFAQSDRLYAISFALYIVVWLIDLCSCIGHAQRSYLCQLMYS